MLQAGRESVHCSCGLKTLRRKRSYSKEFWKGLHLLGVDLNHQHFGSRGITTQGGKGFAQTGRLKDPSTQWTEVIKNEKKEGR